MPVSAPARDISKRIGRVCAALAVALTLPVAARNAAGAADVVSLDASRTHSFDGFGVNLFMAPEASVARDALLRDLHVRFGEINLYRKLPDAEFTSPRTAKEFARRMIAIETPDDRARIERFRDEMHDLGIALHFVYRKYPEPWIERFGDYRGRPEWRLRGDYIADLARWITGQLLWATHHGISPAAVEIAGEPDGNWNALVTPEQFAALLVATRTEMDAADLRAIGIEGPGTSKVWTAGPYLEALQRGGLLGRLSAITLHDYDMIRYPPPAGLIALSPDLRAALGGLPIAVTEFGVEGSHWSAPPFDVGPEHRGGTHPAAASTAYGVAVAAEAIRLLSDGAASVYAWELEDHPWEDLSMGLLDTRGQRRPAAAALQTFLPQIQPGSQVVAGRGAGPGLGAAGFTTPPGPLFVLANLDTTARSVVLRLANLSPMPRTLSPVAWFPASTTAVAASVTAADAKLELPSQSIVVLRGQ